MNTEIEPMVKKQLGKQVDRIVKDSVDDFLNHGKVKTKSDKFDYNEEDEDNFLDEEDETANFSEVDETNSIISDEETERTLARIEAKEAFDLFTEVGDYWEKRGQLVRYDINKGSKLLTKKDHPYSWEELQKEFGGGNYKVMARLPADGNKYLKAQTKSLHDAPETKPDYLFKSLMEKNKLLEDKVHQAVQTPSQPANNGLNMMEVLETVRKNNELALEQANIMRTEANNQAERARREAKEEAKASLDLYRELIQGSKAKDGDNLLTQLTPLLTAILPSILNRPAPIAPIAPDNSKFQFDMMMQIQKMNMDMMEKANETNKEMFRTLSESIKEIAKDKKAPSTENGMGALEMYKMLKDAETGGFEQMRMLNDLAREQALEREELRGERSTPDAPAEKESTVDTVIKSLIPMLAGRMGASSPAPSRAAPQPARQVARPTQQATSSPRGSVSPQNSTRSHEIRANGATIQASEARTNEGRNGQNQEGIRSNQRPVLNVPSLPAPQAPKSFLNAGDDLSFDASTIPTHHKVTEPIVEVSNVVDAKNAEAILTIVAPIAINGYMSETSTVDSISNEVIAELIAQGIDLSTVQRDFDDNTLSGIISSLPEDLQNQTKELRNVIVEKIKGTM